MDVLVQPSDVQRGVVSIAHHRLPQYVEAVHHVRVMPCPLCFRHSVVVLVDKLTKHML
jgi:hypothetical protein